MFKTVWAFLRGGGILRNGLFYGVLALVFFLALRPNKARVRRLNYLRDAARYINRYEEGLSSFKKNMFYEAVEYYQTLLKFRPDYPLQHAMLGYLYARLDKPARALQAYRRAIEENPDYFGLYYNQGLIYFRQKKWVRAVEALTKAAAVSPEATRQFYTVVYRLKFGDDLQSEKAETWLRKQYIRLGEGYVEAFRMLIYAHDQMKDASGTRSAAEKAIALFPDSSGDFHFYAGKAAYDLKDFQTALSYFREALRLNPARGEIYRYLAEILEKAGKPDAARSLRAKAKSLAPLSEQFDYSLFFYPPYYELGTELLDHAREK